MSSKQVLWQLVNGREIVSYIPAAERFAYQLPADYHKARSPFD